MITAEREGALTARWKRPVKRWRAKRLKLARVCELNEDPIDNRRSDILCDALRVGFRMMADHDVTSIIVGGTEVDVLLRALRKMSSR